MVGPCVGTETKVKLLFIEAGLMLAQRQNLSLYLEVYPMFGAILLFELL